MVPSHQPNKATRNSDSNGHNQDTTTIIEQLPPQLTSTQQQAELDSNKLQSPEQDAENLVKDGQKQSAEHQQVPRRQWQGLSLKTKATALAIALGVLPILAIGAINYFLSSKDIREDAIQTQESLAATLGGQIDRFMFERHGDIEILRSLRVFTDPKLRNTTSRQEKDAQLNRFLAVYGFYDSIAVLDLNGNVIAQVGGDVPRQIKTREYFQAILKTDRTVISQPEASKVTGKLSIFLAGPVKDTVTGKTIAVVRTRMPAEVLDRLLKTQENQLSREHKATEYHLVDANGKFFVTAEKEQVGRDARADFSSFAQMQAGNKITSAIDIDKLDKAKQLVSYTPVLQIQDIPKLNWSILLGQDAAHAFAAERNLLLTLLYGTGVTALVVGAIAAYLADRATRPVLAAAGTVEKLGQGELDTRIAVAGGDEIAMLGSNINLMADQLQERERALIEYQEAQSEQTRFFTNLNFLRAHQSQDLEAVFNKALKGARKILKVDRVVVYRFYPDWRGYIAAESVASGLPTALADKIEDSCIGEDLIEAYKKGRLVPTNNVFEAGFHPEHLKLMERLQVKANLVTPILKDRQLFGLLIAHHCSKPHAWEQSEINFLGQLGTQLGSILERVALLEQQKTAKEQLQKRALELLMQVDPVSRGDLTIRASVTEDEIGTVADSYNATIASLRKIVTQVQAAARQVATTTSSSEASVQELSAEALQQTQEVTAALDRIQEMSNSIRAVAKSAEQAEAAVQQANLTVEVGDAAMDRTVEGIMAIQETVTEASTKVKRLGEASQKISKVVNLIGSFADQTNLLALNAAIEAARAGEEGRGFAVVADEVGALALKSAEATAEIESLVKEIQTETNEVVAAMEAGTLQVAEGTKLVDETRLSLNQITVVSAQIGSLVQAIIEATVAQSQVSSEVSQTMSGVAAIANQTAHEATQVSVSFKELLAVAQDLQASASQFKVS